MSSAPLDPCNVVVLVGRVARDPFSRTLASGEVSVEVDVTIPGPPSETVNVVVDGGAEALALAAGSEVLVVGRVRRRFFRAGGSTQSRTEVIAAEVLAARRTKRSAHAVEEAASTILQLVTPPGG